MITTSEVRVLAEVGFGVVVDLRMGEKVCNAHCLQLPMLIGGIAGGECRQTQFVRKDDVVGADLRHEGEVGLVEVLVRAKQTCVTARNGKAQFHSRDAGKRSVQRFALRITPPGTNQLSLAGSLQR